MMTGVTGGSNYAIMRGPRSQKLSDVNRNVMMISK